MLLAIDTCGTTGTIALGRWDGKTVTVLAQAELAGKTFSAQLVPRIRELFAGHSAEPRDLQAIIVVNGPGSFTGVRIGVSAAKGLAEALRIPVLAVSRLALLARKGGTHAAALDAGRSEFYFGRYTADPAEQLLARDHFLQLSTTFLHNLGVCEPSVHALVPSATLVDPPTAVDAIDLALPRLRAHDYDDPLTLDGNYLRRSDAEIFAKSPRPGSGQLDSPRP